MICLLSAGAKTCAYRTSLQSTVMTKGELPFILSMNLIYESNLPNLSSDKTAVNVNESDDLEFFEFQSWLDLVSDKIHYYANLW